MNQAHSMQPFDNILPSNQWGIPHLSHHQSLHYTQQQQYHQTFPNQAITFGAKATPLKPNRIATHSQPPPSRRPKHNINRRVSNGANYAPQMSNRRRSRANTTSTTMTRRNVSDDHMTSPIYTITPSPPLALNNSNQNDAYSYPVYHSPSSADPNHAIQGNNQQPAEQQHVHFSQVQRVNLPQRPPLQAHHGWFSPQPEVRHAAMPPSDIASPYSPESVGTGNSSLPRLSHNPSSANSNSASLNALKKRSSLKRRNRLSGAAPMLQAAVSASLLPAVPTGYHNNSGPSYSPFPKNNDSHHGFSPSEYEQSATQDAEYKNYEFAAKQTMQPSVEYYDSAPAPVRNYPKQPNMQRSQTVPIKPEQAARPALNGFANNHSNYGQLLSVSAFLGVSYIYILIVQIIYLAAFMIVDEDMEVMDEYGRPKQLPLQSMLPQPYVNNQGQSLQPSRSMPMAMHTASDRYQAEFAPLRHSHSAEILNEYNTQPPAPYEPIQKKTLPTIQNSGDAADASYPSLHAVASTEAASSGHESSDTASTTSDTEPSLSSRRHRNEYTKRTRVLHLHDQQSYSRHSHRSRRSRRHKHRTRPALKYAQSGNTNNTNMSFNEPTQQQMRDSWKDLMSVRSRLTPMNSMSQSTELHGSNATPLQGNYKSKWADYNIAEFAAAKGRLTLVNALSLRRAGSEASTYQNTARTPTELSAVSPAPEPLSVHEDEGRISDDQSTGFPDLPDADQSEQKHAREDQKVPADGGHNDLPSPGGTGSGYISTESTKVQIHTRPAKQRQTERLPKLDIINGGSQYTENEDDQKEEKTTTESSQQIVSQRVNKQHQYVAKATKLSAHLKLVGNTKNYQKSKQTVILLREAMKRNTLFAELADKMIGKIIEQMYQIVCPKNECLVKQDEMSNAYFVVESGAYVIIRCDKDKIYKVIGSVACKSAFGEDALLYSTPHTASYKATGDSIVWVLDAAKFVEIRQKLTHKKAKKHGRKVKFLQNYFKMNSFGALHTADCTEIAGVMKPTFYRKGTTVINQGKPCTDLFIVYKGTCDSFRRERENKNRRLASYMDGDAFGDDGTVYNCTVVASSDMLICYVLNREEFRRLLRCKQTNYKYSKSALVEYDEIELHKPLRKRVSTKLSAFQNCGVLGVGTFGQVSLVEDPHSSKTYALKKIRKNRVVDSNYQHVHHIRNERAILSKLNSNHCVGLYATYKDELSVYLLLETILGGELFYLLKFNEKFPEKTARFYAANVILAFEHIHSKNVIFRDLKPENLLIAPNGYVKLVGFGFAKARNDSCTLCGTPQYLSPEIITCKNQSFTLDWWTLGILIYEMVIGHPPFLDDANVKMYEKILSGAVEFPAEPRLSQTGQDLVNSLLCKDAYKRLGSGLCGAHDVSQHPWFSDFDWEQMRKQQIKPPYVPKIEHNKDVSNFEYVPEQHVKEQLMPDPTGKLYAWCNEF